MSTPEQIVDDNIVQRVIDGAARYMCRHCGADISTAGPRWREEVATVYQGGPSSAGPHLNDNARHYLDVDVVVRQGYCSGCFTTLFTETAPTQAVQR
ncbi:hypothetical protein [Nocardia arthritidis]|uniref:hypothetical protein n=1 Tax=Nocardia arthritidis TaxID=228602 RepID=UPI0007A3CC63|nr:hypothetical protein [Nocardia arthritidis]